MTMPVTPESFWKGDGGDQYVERNRFDYKARIPFWSRVIALTRPVSILEVGCNIGNNLRAIQELDYATNLLGIDLNTHALVEAANAGFDVREASAVEVGMLWPMRFDLVFTAGVLIHVPPTKIKDTMLSIRRASKRWVVAVEYEAERETEILYRGEKGLLWKRPFGKMYEEIGMKIVEEGDAGEGFDRCRAWLCQKN